MRYIVLIISFLIAAAFVVANWATITAETTVDLFFTKAQAPIGLILVIVFGILFFVFVCTMVVQQSAALLGYRRILKDRDAQKKLATQAEDSRLVEVRKELDAKLAQAAEQRKAETADLEKRLADSARAQLDSLKITVSEVKASNEELADQVKANLQALDDKVTKALISANKVAHAIGVQNGSPAPTAITKDITPDDVQKIESK